MNNLLQYNEETIVDILNIIVSYLDYYDFCEIYESLPYHDMLVPYSCSINPNFKQDKLTKHHILHAKELIVYDYKNIMKPLLCLANPVKLDLSGLDSDICFNHMSRLQSLRLAFIPIRQDEFNHCKQLKKLVIEEISRNIDLNHLEDLEELCVLHSDLHYSSYKNCKKLKKLKIHSNREICFFNNHPNLTELDLRNVTCIPNCISECKLLDTLRMYNITASLNNLNSLSNLTNLTNLRTLHAVNCNLTDEHIRECVNLTDLNITGNKIKNLNKFKNLIKLEYMNSDINEKDIEKCTKLTYLNISGNKVIKDLNNFNNLQTLICRNTSINKHSIHNLVNLTRLDISGCHSLKIDIFDVSDISVITKNMRIAKTDDSITIDGKKYLIINT